ncbi:MAG: hypothetical protein AAF517_26035, partial [Planctomycetota bacterium]
DDDLVEAWTLLEPHATQLSQTRSATLPENDLRKADRAKDVGEWMRPDESPLEVEMQAAFTPTRSSETSPIERPSSAQKKSWLRYFSKRVLPEGMRRRLEAKTRHQLSQKSERERLRERKLRAVKLLLRKLSSADWRDGISLALPLRAPSDRESQGPWLAEFEMRSRGTEFSLDRAAARTALGRVEVSSEIHGRLRKLYRGAAKRCLREFDYRQAAHIYSYLLGDHAKAAKALQAGSHHREAATVWYHLSNDPARAASALESGELFDEAARLWMDAGKWKRAALAWEETGDERQSEAAWRKLSFDLRRRGRTRAAAEILFTRLREHRTAIELLQRDAFRLEIAAVESAKQSIELASVHRGKAKSWEFADAFTQHVIEAARNAPRRRSVRRLIEWVSCAIQLHSPKPLLERGQLESIWSRSVDAIGRARELVNRRVREEINSQLTDLSQRVGRALQDPFLPQALSSWIAASRESPESDNETSPTATTDLRLPFSGSCLERWRGSLYIADDEGNVHRFSEGDLRPSGSVDTKSNRVTCLAGDAEHLYASSGSTILHFSGTCFDDASRRRPLQTERSFGGNVDDLALLPDGSGLLRRSTRSVLLLHPAHLLLDGSVIEDLSDDGDITSVAANRDFVAIVVSLGRTKASERLRTEIQLYRRRASGGRNRFRLLETFPGPASATH